MRGPVAKDRDPERQRRKIIFLISDGVNGPKFNVNKYDVVLKELLRSELRYMDCGWEARLFDRRFERLSKYAHDTGGDVYYGLKSRAMEELYSRVTRKRATSTGWPTRLPAPTAERITTPSKCA